MAPRDDPTDRLERAIADIGRLLGARHLTADVARRSGLELPPLSWGLLEHLAGVEHMRVSDIAACQGVDISTVTPRLQTLEAAGLIERGRLDTDARVSLIRISQRGIDALEEVHAARREVLRESIDPDDRARLAAAADVLEGMVRGLREPAAYGPAVGV